MRNAFGKLLLCVRVCVCVCVLVWAEICKTIRLHLATNTCIEFCQRPVGRKNFLFILYPADAHTYICRTYKHVHPDLSAASSFPHTLHKLAIVRFLYVEIFEVERTCVWVLSARTHTHVYTHSALHINTFT